MAHRDTSGEFRRDVCAGANSTVFVPVLVPMTSGAASVEVDEGRAGDARRERADGRWNDEGFSGEEGGGHDGRRMQRVALSAVSAVQWWWGEFKSVGETRRPLLAGSPRASPSLIGRCILSYLCSCLQSLPVTRCLAFDAHHHAVPQLQLFTARSKASRCLSRPANL